MSSWQGNRNGVVVGLMSLALMVSSLSLASGVGSPGSEPPKTKTATTKKAAKATDKKTVPKQDKGTDAQIAAAKKAAMESIRKKQAEKIGKQRADDRFKMARELAERRRLARPATPRSAGAASGVVKPPAVPRGGVKTAAEELKLQGKGYDPSKVVRVPRRTGPPPAPKTQPAVVARPAVKVKPGEPPRPTHGVPTLPKRSASPRGTKLPVRGPGRSGKSAVGVVPPMGTSREVAADGGIVTPTMRFPATQPDPDARAYRFDYVDTPWPDVLSDVARISGLVLVGDYKTITDTVSFRSPQDFTFTEVLHTLNNLLLDRPMDKRLVERDGIYLAVWRLPDRIKKIPPEKMYQTFEAFEAADLDPFDMALTYFEPPPGWTPFEVIDEFRTHFDDYYGTEVDGDRIELTGLVRDHYKFRETLAALAVGPPPDADTGRTKVVRKLHVRKAAEIQQVLRQIFPIQTAPKGNRPGVNPSAEKAKQTTIVPDAANNQLIIKAAPTVLAQILETIDTLDSGPEVRAPVVQRVVLVNTGTATILQALKPILATQRTEMAKKSARTYIPPDIQDAVNVDIFPDMAGNAVVLVGSAAGVAAATEMVKQWDVAGAGKDHIIELEYADAAELTATLSNIFPIGNPKAGGGGARFQPQSGNRLLVVCSDADLERVSGLIEKLDVPPDDEASERFVHLKSARPSEIAPILEQVASGSGGGATPRRAPVRRIIKGKRVVRRPVVRRTGGGGATGPRFIPDDASRLLIVYCNNKDWEKIEPIIRRLDDEAEVIEPVYHTFALAHADAADVVAMLNQMYPPPPRMKGAATTTAAYQFFADPYNNTVRVYASQPFMDEITPLIEKLDIQTQGELTIIKLEHARAEEVAVTLRENFGGGGTVRRRTVVTKGKVRRPMRMSSATSTKGVVINAEPVTNSLLITAPPEKLDQIKALVADIDRESESKEPSRVILTAENRPAGEIANTLLSLTGRGARRVVKRKPGQQGASGIAGGGSLKVVPSGNRVILDGPRDEVAKAVQLFTEIDVHQQTPVFKKYAVLDAEETEAALRPMLGVAGPAGGKVKAGAKRRPASRVSRPSAIQIHANIYDNTILVGAMPEDFPRIDALLETILRDGDPVDPDMPTDMGEFWIIQLKHRKAFDIAFDVEDLLKPPGKQPGPTLEEGPTERTLLVRSKPSQREKIRELVEMFDVPDTTRDMGAYSMTLDPEEKMSPKVLAELVKAQLADRIGRKVEVVGLWDTGNVEIVDVHAGEPPAAETPVDASENTATSQPVSPCVLPASLLRAVEAVTLGQTSAGRHHADDPIDPRPCPVCHQSPCVLPARLVRSLDAVATASMGQTPPGDDAPDPESARPPVTHNHLIVESGSSETPSAESAEFPAAVEVEAAPTGPIRIITGPFGKVFVEGVTEEEQEIIDEIVSDLTSGKAPTVIRVFPLKYADVAVAAQLLNQVFNQQVPARRQPQRAVKQPQIPGVKGGAQAGGQKARGGQPRAPRVQPSRIKVVPDPRTRSLLVAAPTTDIPLIVEVLRQIDRKVPPKEQNLKIFKLENLDATQVVDNLREVLGLSGGSRRQPGRGGARGQAGRGGQQAAQQRIIQMQQGRQQQRQGTVVSSENIKLTAEAQTNSIIAQAPPDTLELIAKLIGDLETETNTTKKEMRRVHLEYAKATEVATIVRDVAAQTTARPGGGGRGGRGARRGGSSSTGVSVNADARTNSVILAGQAKDLDQVETIVKELDVDTGAGEGIRQFSVRGDAKSISSALKSVFGAGGKDADVVISSDTSTGTVLVKAPAKEMEEIERQISEMDSKVAMSQQRQSIEVTRGDAEKIAQNLQDLFRDSRSRRGSKQNITIKGNKSSKRLYVTGADDETFKQITEIAAEMDQSPTDIQVQAFHLEHASAIDVDQKLTTMMGKAMATGGVDFDLDLVGVVPDARTNSLIVTGGPMTFALIGEVLKQIDVEPETPIARETKSYTLPRAVNANEVSNNIKALFAGQSFRKTGIEAPTVTANMSSNIVTVLANATQHDQIKTSIIDPILAAVGEPLKDYRVTLKFQRAEDIKPTLEDFMNKWRQSRGSKPQDAFTITADPNANILLLNCSPSTYMVFDTQLKAMDTEESKPIMRELRTYSLKYANINSVRDAITQAFRRTGRVPERDQVAVSLDSNTNSVLVLASEKNHEQITQMITSMDVEGGAGTVQDFLYEVNNARAVDLANTLNNIIHNSRTPTRGKYPINVIGDDATNRLVVTASQADYESILNTIESLDVKGAVGLITRTFTFKYAEAWHLPRVINEQFRTRSRNPNDQVAASYINGTMSIVVTASQENMTKVEALIEQADLPSVDSAKETRFFKLVNARADGLARMLNDAHRAATPRPRNGVYPITYGADMNSNTLVVTASTDRFEAIAARIAELDSDEAAGRTTRSFPVKYVAGWTLASIINQQFRSGSRNPIDQVQASYEDGTMSIIVTANEKNMKEVERLIAESDKMNTGNVKETRFIQLTNARADELARSLNDAFRAKTVRSRQGQWPVTVTADVASNNLIVTATTDMFVEITQMVTELDVEQQGAAERLRRVFKLTYADPGSVQGAISESYRQTGRNPSPRDVVAVARDWTTNSVIVTASRKNMDGIASLIEEIDKPGDAQRSQHVIEVSNTNASDVARSLQDVFTAANRGRRQRQSATIRAIEGTTKIAVYANAEELDQIRELVQQIDIEGGRAVHTIVMPELVPAKTVADTINDLFGGGGRRGRGDGVHAEYHEPTNTLLVHATESEFKKIKEQVIDVLSTEDTKFAVQDYRIHLQYAVADEVARTLQEFFDKKSGSAGRRNLPPWMRFGGSQEQQRENQVSIIAEPSSNMLLVSCTEKTKTRIDDIIAEIDVDPSENSTMEMVSLKYMDAADMLDILTEYLRVSKRSPEDGGRQGVPWWARGRQNQQEEKTVLAGDMRLKAVESLNAIIVAGKPEGVADTVAKIEELDQPDEALNRPVTIKLAHYNASELADILKQMYEDRGRQRGSSGTQAPTIVPVEATNSLLIKGKRSDVSLIEEMAKNLDADIEEEGGGGVRIVQLKAGRDVEELARKIEDQINEVEENKKRTRRDYRPDKVSIGADVTSNSLLVSASKAKFEEVKELVKTLEEMGPVGGTSRQVIRLKNLSPDQARQLIEQLQQGTTGSGTGRGGRSRRGGRRGRRSDAGWQQGRPLDRAMEGRTVRRMTVAGTLPVFFAQVALGMAVAQTPKDAKPAKPPQSFTIRKVQKKAPTTQPKKPVGKVRPAKRGAAKVPVVRRGGKRLTPEQAIRATTQPSAIGQMSAAAQQAFRKRLSNAPISVSEAGPDAVIIEANDQDMEVIQSILEMLDTALPQKTIEYIPLHNAQARELAGTLQNVFSKIEKIGERSVRPEDKVDIIADPGTNGLYIAATKEKMAQALELIRQNEEAAGETTKLVRTIPFKNRRVSEVGDTLRKMTTAYLRQKGLPTDAIQIEIDAPTNSIFVTAGEADLKFVEQIIKGLDAELPPAEEQKYQVGTADIMIVPLRVAEADKLGTLLNELLQKAATGDTPMQDFIRRFRLLDEHGEPLATVDLNRPIVIFGEPESNSLIIASTKENCLIMKQVAAVFDKEPARAVIEHKILTLVHADATEVTEQLNAMLGEAESLTQRPGKSGGGFGQPDGDTGYLVYKAVVKADPRTNQVVVIGRPDAVKLLTELAASLDVKGLDVMPFEIVKLEYASAAALEAALTDMIDKRAESLPKGTGPNADKAEKVVIKGDPRSRSLIIAARKVRMEELKGLIHRLDVPATGLVDDIRTITLKEGNATEMADTLKTLWEQRKQEQEGTGGFKLEVPAIVADARSNSLIVAASKGDFDAIEQVVAKIESLELNPMANIYIVTLKYNSAQQLSSAMTALFQKRAQMRTVDGKTRPEDEVEIQVDEVTNSLLVAASRENIEVLRQKVAELDQEMGIAGQVEFFICDNIEAGRVKDTVDELCGGDGVFKPGAGGDSALAQKRERVTVTIDSRANMLIVSASPENMSLVRQVYTRMNSVQMPWDAAITKLITIEHGDAVRISAQLQEHFDKLDQVRGGGGQGTGGNSGFGITVFADERSNRIIIGGTKDGIDRAVSLTHQLDVPPGDGTSTIVVYGPLREAAVTRVGEMIRNVFQERNQSRGSGPQVQNIPVTVEPDERSNTLLVSASREDHALIKDVIDRLDRRSNLLEMVKLYPLKEARADRIKEILDELFQAAAGGGGAGGGGATVGVTVDNRTNAVLVAAPPGELENLDVLIQQLDTAEPVGTAEIGIFQCENEDASKMVDLLNEILTGAAAAGGGGGGAGQENDSARAVDSLLIKYDFQDEKGRQLLMQMMQKNVRISFNERTNNVIVVAPPASLHLMEALIRKLDRIQKRAVMVKVFTLVQADATRMVDLLEAMFAQDQGSDQQRAFQEGREFEVEGGLSTTGAVPSAASQGGPTVKGTFGRPRTTFTADERTNAVIAAGWPEDIDVVADIIDQLDSRAIRDRDYVVYTLINAQAADVQTALDAYFQAETARMDRLGDNVAPQRRMDQEVSVVAHEESNQLLISASPRFKSSVLNMVEQLDLPPPQVMIQVMIAEVTLSDRFEMGLEFALQQLRFSETALPGGNGVLQSTHFDVIGGTDLGAAGSGVGGFSFTITGEDFNFLVRALQSDSRLEVIQRPMIMCQDNQEANITIGNQVPFVRNTQVTDNGQVTSQIEYEDIGIILDVEPHINPDGWVYLHVAPEISAITDSTIDVGNGVLAPIFTNRTADTTVAVKDGETVVIGGLITTSENEAETKVPFLGDLPGVGALFRSMTRRKDKTELMIALTPRIVRTIEDGRRLSIEERDKAGIITENMKQSPLFEGLQMFPESEGEIEDIEAPPTVPGLPVQPSRQTPHRHYGPKVPEYGPRLPVSDEILTRRDGPAHGVDGAR